MTTDAQTPQLVLTPKTVVPFMALVGGIRTTLKQLGDVEPLMASLYEEAARLGLAINGPSQWHYIGATGDDTQEFQLNVVLPIQKVGAPSDQFAYTELPAFSCVSYEYTGAWSDMPAVYDRVFAQFYRDGYTEGTIVREVHTVVDLANPQRCVTEVQVSIA